MTTTAQAGGIWLGLVRDSGQVQREDFDTLLRPGQPSVFCKVSKAIHMYEACVYFSPVTGFQIGCT